MSLGPPKLYEPKVPKNLRPEKDMKWYELKGPKLLWIQDTKSYESNYKGTRCFSANRQTIVNTRPQKFYEPKANHVACSANAASSPPTPLQLFLFLKPTSSAGSAHPRLKLLHLQLKPQKKRIIPKYFGTHKTTNRLKIPKDWRASDQTKLVWWPENPRTTRAQRLEKVVRNWNLTE